eukprot:4036201-Prymnesium_polylepis.1
MACAPSSRTAPETTRPQHRVASGSCGPCRGSGQARARSPRADRCRSHPPRLEGQPRYSATTPFALK